MAAKLENVSVNEGQDAEFVCKFISNPEPSTISWFKNETEELIANENIIITNTKDTTTIKFINCQSSDNGNVYTVKIVNQLGEVVSNKATLNWTTANV